MEAMVENWIVSQICCWCWTTGPRYPEIEVRVARAKPPLMIAATREALRRAGVAKIEIDDFSARAFASTEAEEVCRQWVSLVVQAR
jgi:hypothetical protein